MGKTDTSRIVTMPGVHKIEPGAVADPKTVAIARELLVRAERGEIQSVAIFGIESNLQGLRIRHTQSELHLRLTMAALVLETADITDYLNYESVEVEDIATDDSPEGAA